MSKEDESWQLPDELLTPERLEESERVQMELAKRINSPYAHKSPKDIAMFRAGIVIKETEIIQRSRKLSDVEREQYAESLAEIGEYGKAAKVTKNKLNRTHWREIWKAIMRDDNEKCNCNHQVFGNQKVNNLFVEAEIFSLKHNKVMPLIKCANPKCKHRNVTHLPASISKERDQRKQVLGLVSGQKPNDAKAILANNNINAR